MTDLVTDVELARRFGLTRRAIVDLCRDQGWPHVKLGRALRFTEEHVKEILALHTVSPMRSRPESHALEGQTARSAARSARAR